MLIKRIPAGIYAANCYLIVDEETRQTAVIDPGGDEDDIIKELERLNGEPKFILLTHGHMDHVGGVDVLREKYNLPVYIDKKDEELINRGEAVFAKLSTKGRTNLHLNDGDTFALGKLTIKCIGTPGHTPGGMCFLVDDHLFTGDTLFAGSIGRTDFAGGNFQELIGNIKNKLLVLDDNFKVLPGHGAQSTIGRERTVNPFL